MRKSLLFLALSISIYFISCENNDTICETVVCENGGECDDEGNCNCPPEYEGVNCELLANPKEIKISKIIVTDFLAMNGNEQWDSSDGPDLVIEMSKGSVSGGTVVNSTEVIENAVHGNDYEFIVDWSMDGDELVYNFDLRDSDPEVFQTFSIFMGSNQLYLADFRVDKPEIIDLPALSGGFLGLRLEVEWIFE